MFNSVVFAFPFIVYSAVFVLKFRFTFITALFILFLPVELVAQAVVRPASSSVQNTVANPPAEASIVYEMQAMQEELQSLRGMVEQQAYEIKRLKQQRLDDYLDVDKRLSELTRQQQSTTQQLPLTSVSSESTSPTTVSSSVIGNNSQAADALYNEGISLLLDKQDYDGAKAKFADYLDKYLGGKYTPNVYYWQGQILFANGEKKAAADNFELLISEYPSHLKVPDAQFKLARIYFDQGKKKEAKEILDQVALSDTDAALLAKSFISKNY